jgi:hypothetical protein
VIEAAQQKLDEDLEACEDLRGTPYYVACITAAQRNFQVAEVFCFEDFPDC